MAELGTLERKGVLVEVPHPQYLWVEPEGAIPLGLRVSGIAAMHSNIVITFVRELVIEEPRKGPRVVIDEGRSYQAILQGEGIIIRFDSGHATHNTDPHLHVGVTTMPDWDPPTMPLASPIELGNFIERIEDWRLDNGHRLPVYPATLEDVRWP
jgi:hypothetical protein